MPTKRPRISITFNQPIADILDTLAKHERRSLASLVNEMVLEALERREDMALSTIADARDTIAQTKTIKHKNVSF